MKNLILCLLIFIPEWVYPQDMIILKDKSTINARVVEEDKGSVLYITQDGDKKILKQIPIEEVKKIKYEKVPRSVNVIEIVHESLRNEFLLNDIINHLIMKGYVIDEFDNKYYTVITQYDQNDRITVEIEDNKAFFRCFHLDIEDEVVPHVTAVITYEKKPKPGEKIGYFSGPTFKKLDALCRSYLKDGHEEMIYKSEYVE